MRPLPLALLLLASPALATTEVPVPPPEAPIPHALEGAARRSFCADPFAALCGPRGEAFQRREAEHSGLVRAILLEAFDRAARETGVPVPDLASWKRMLRERADSEELYAVHMEAVRAAIEARIEGGFGQLLEFCDTVRRDLDAWLDEEPGLGAESRRVLRGRLWGMRMVSAERALRGAADYNLRRNVRNVCGEDGLGDNAFFDRRGRLVLCPGAILQATGLDPEPGGPDLDARRELLFLLAHEMGHSMDGHDGPVPEFEAFRGCAASHPRDAGDPATNLAEMLADHWGAGAVAVRTRRTVEAERFSLLHRSAEFFCDPGESPGYAPGTFRVGTLLGAHPGVRDAAGCGPPAQENPACTMGGAVPAAAP